LLTYYQQKNGNTIRNRKAIVKVDAYVQSGLKTTKQASTILGGGEHDRTAGGLELRAEKATGNNLYMQSCWEIWNFGIPTLSVGMRFRWICRYSRQSRDLHHAIPSETTLTCSCVRCMRQNIVSSPAMSSTSLHLIFHAAKSDGRLSSKRLYILPPDILYPRVQSATT
jgi:hypothetical protein